jgi:Protein of unknown function (DUF1501)
VKGGRISGSTDEFGVQAAKMQAAAQDVNATILRLMGITKNSLILTKAKTCARLTCEVTTNSPQRLR